MMGRKATTPKQPEGSIPVRSYAGLQRYARGFARGHFGLVIICGPPGTGKSKTIQTVIGRSACWIEGNASAYGMYRELFAARNTPVIIDDVDALYSDRNAVRLLKTLCQSDEVKSLAWHTASTQKKDSDVPSRFDTSSRVIIICNEWKTSNQNVLAIQDRGTLIYFDPTPLEIHKAVGKWFWDPTIYQWVGSHLGLWTDDRIRLSMRFYVVAAEHKAAGMEWLPLLHTVGIPKRTVLAAMLAESDQFTSTKQRVEFWTKKGYGSRACYFEHAKALAESFDEKASRMQLDNPDTASELGIVG